MKSGIYVIRNLINNKLYIGSATTIKSRWRCHKNMLTLNKHHSQHLQSAYNKYGKENFSYEIIEHCTLNKLKIREQLWLNIFKPENNMTLLVERPMLGRKLSKEQKLKISLSHKGVKHSEARKNAISLSKLGERKTDETKKKMSLAKKGKKHFLGKHHTEETKAKMRKPKTKEAKIKMSKPKSEETKAKMKIAQKKRRQMAT